MFREAAAIGEFDVQLIYYRGRDECRASQWMSQPERLAALMERIDCRTALGRRSQSIEKFVHQMLCEFSSLISFATKPY